MHFYDVNFDGIVGPTHYYGGLSFGNIASFESKHQNSNPKEAALQGLKKMYDLHQMGILQAVLLPHERPNLAFLKKVGYTGSNREILNRADFKLLMASASSSSMWAANAATFAPSTDTRDGKAHFVPANLCANLHRCIESEMTVKILKKLFPFAIHHDPLPATFILSDEGAANHGRFSDGVHLFVYGRGGGEENPKKFPARQTLEASQAVSRLLQVESCAIFAKQHPEAVDAGVFHNDVISLAFENIFFFHERAFLHTEKILVELRKRVKNLIEIRINENEIPLEVAVETYLFNSQIVRNGKGELVLIAPVECRENEMVYSFLKGVPFFHLHFVDLKQSMQNGGGPACLRLCVRLSKEEIKRTFSGVFLTDALYLELQNWVKRHFRDRLNIEDIRDVELFEESRSALDALTKILHLGSFYDFQM